MPMFFDGFDDRYYFSNGWAEIDARSDEIYNGFWLYFDEYLNEEVPEYRGIEQYSRYDENGWCYSAPRDGQMYDWWGGWFEKNMHPTNAYNYWHISFSQPGLVNSYGMDFSKGATAGTHLCTIYFTRAGGLWAYHRTGVSTYPRLGDMQKLMTMPTWAWTNIEMYCGFGLGAGNDFIKVWINGELAYNATGLQIGTYPSYDTTGGGRFETGIISGVDDLFIQTSNSPISGIPYGESLVESLKPTANGTDAGGFTPNTGTNWSNLTEQVQDFDTSYNEGSGTGTRDSFVIEDLSGRVDASAVVKGVSVRMFCTQSATGESIRPYLLIGGTRYYGDTVTPNINGKYGYLNYVWETNPATASAWTVTDVDGIEAGYEVV